ncbi:hypothetical protein AUR04nite_00060 [Glutamicibacter uratoxydans]|uniref:Lipoprotein n=1 Tax=Glutamicibacter uratoxydans TaxID=43667 RepID=A0A4Y4DKX5_GLUUR|nr:hypothetical protein [Glutamicibacter uratoxydans]GED04474.1 hypothetical protein AUR04nite_00060 [Glutamicibacter uratoxydans]
MRLKKTIALASVAGLTALSLAACGPAQEPTGQYKQVEQKAASKTAYIPKNDTELDNYNKAQELYDDPAAIQFCTAFPSSNSAPIVTTPIAGKLTTSSTTFFNPQEPFGGEFQGQGMVTLPKRSVDGLYHGDSFYRYGFTPGGQYVDFSNSLELMCTTALTEFQRQKTFVEGVDTDKDVSKLQAEAEQALKDGDNAKATKILGGK